MTLPWERTGQFSQSLLERPLPLAHHKLRKHGLPFEGIPEDIAAPTQEDKLYGPPSHRLIDHLTSPKVDIVEVPRLALV
jgi:hypothetical protein